MTTMKIKVTKWETDEQGKYDVEETHKVAAKWEICPVCEGCGTDRGASVESDGGGLTGSEWEEACRDCEDFAENYFGGVYDKPCQPCKGLGRILVPDRDRIDAELLALIDQEAKEAAEYAAESAAERRMGY